MNNQAILEVDETIHFVLFKVNQIRIWTVQNRDNRQIVSFLLVMAQWNHVNVYGENYRMSF